MMDLLLATSGGEAQAASGGYVDDVFSAYTYTGNGSTQTINNGIDLAGKGGLVWIKQRNGADNHILTDGHNSFANLKTNSTVGDQWPAYISSFSSNGYVHPTGTWTGSESLVSWTFRRSERFFDVVTYTGNGAAGRQIAHSLGVQAGFVTVKATSTTGDWNSYHRSATGDLKLNLTDAQTASRAIIAAADANSFTVSGAANTNGVSYVAYLFAHDPSADGIIQCVSFTTDASGNATVNLGWEPQFVMYKRSDSISSWAIADVSRGWSNTAIQRLNADSSTSEGGYTANTPNAPTATGMQFTGLLPASATYIYLAIRRPNKPPTSGTQVYNASTASGVVSAGFPVDLHIGATRAGAASNHAMHARLTGGTKELVTSSTAAEVTITDLGFDSMTGLRASLPAGGVNHFFRRAPGFFDVVCYTGTNVARTVPHGLGVAPELMIVKGRSIARKWCVYHAAIGGTKAGILNTTEIPSGPDGGYWNNATPTSTTFPIGGDFDTNGNTYTYVAYLFASLPGISKVGSYAGNGSSQTIDCGFSTGARFVLIKRTDATGDWYVWDSVRGIIAANDPHLSLNTTAAEVTTDDSVDPDASGFIVNQNTATNINVNGGSYIFLAIA